jgi:uncharacterized repeat protein (TIGR01451 family)
MVNAILTETIPADTTFLPANNPSWSCNGATCTYALGTVDPLDNDFVDFTLQVNTLAAAFELVQNTAALGTALNRQLKSASDTTAINAAPDLYVSKTDNLNGTTPGKLLKYVITYGNRGNQNATGVTLTELVPVDTRFNRAQSNPGWSCVPSTGQSDDRRSREQRDLCRFGKTIRLRLVCQRSNHYR